MQGPPPKKNLDAYNWSTQYAKFDPIIDKVKPVVKEWIRDSD